jgi:hypothetical protein
MSNFFGLIKHGPKAGKYVMETIVPKISKNLKEFQKHKEDIIKSTDKHSKGLTTEGSINVKKTVAPALSKLSKLTQKIEKKATGGRVGLKRGTKKKSNVDKIKKTFGPKSLGMQSVIYGLDKNPKITAADPKAKFIAAAKKKTKKKVI